MLTKLSVCQLISSSCIPTTFFPVASNVWFFAGKRVYLNGRLHYTLATLPDGTMTNRASINAENLQILESVGRRNDDIEENRKPRISVDEGLD